MNNMSFTHTHTYRHKRKGEKGGVGTRSKGGKKILPNKNVAHFNSFNQLELKDTYRTLYSTGEYIFFSSAHRTFSRIDHMLGHKTNLNKC